jgi:hypothetical protein
VTLLLLALLVWTLGRTLVHRPARPELGVGHGAEEPIGARPAGAAADPVERSAREVPPPSPVTTAAPEVAPAPVPAREAQPLE